MDWIYGQIVGFLGNFFALMGNMGVELFELEWVSAIILFFSRLAWALFAVSVVVCAFECGIEYSTGRGNLQQCGMNIIKGFLAVSLFTVVPVRLYALSVSLQGTFSAGLTGYGRSIGEVGQDIITELSKIQTLADVVNSSHFGLGIITSPIMLLFCVILMGYAVLKVFFANLKRGGMVKKWYQAHRVALYQPTGLRQEILQRFPHHYGGQVAGGHRSSGQQVQQAG